MRLNPGHARAHHNLGVVLWARGQLDEAGEQYAAALAIDPDYASACHNLGVVRWQQGRTDEATACFRRAAELGPNVARYQSSLAFALAEQGSPDEARRHYEQARRLGPDWVRALIQDAWVLATHADGQARCGANAVFMARQACRAPGGRRPEALDALAAALAECGRFEEAARTAHEGAELARVEGNSELAAGLEQRRRLYESGKPFRVGAGQRW